MRSSRPLLIAFVLCLGILRQGGGDDRPSAKKPTAKNGPYAAVKLKVDRPSANVDIRSYVLITNDLNARRQDANAIMKLKAAWPLAMQTKDKALFERILAQDFTFIDNGVLMQRAPYIRDRINPKGPRVEAVRYDNLVLQFFRDTALLTYRNVVDAKNADGKEGKLYISWADVYVREKDQWKIGASHAIETRIEPKKPSP